MSMVDESPRYYIENGNFYHYTPSNLYLSAGFYVGTDVIRENLGDIHKNKEKMCELIENGYEIYDYDKKKWVEIKDIEILEKDKENLEQSDKQRERFELHINNPITAADRGMAEEIIINLKRVEQDYRIDLTREIEWLRNKVKKGNKQ